MPKGKTADGGAEVRTVSLALQGGGSHGAFTWGVLDRLLDDGRLRFEGISGTSAGAINGALVAQGMHQTGTQAARDHLARFWQAVGHRAAFTPFQPTWLDRVTGDRNLGFSPGYAAFDLLMRVASPYQFNPFDYNPLRELLGDVIDFASVEEDGSPRLFVSATDVRRGRLKVFEGRALSVDALLASACLPFLFQAVEIDGDHYWDGGYMGNPTLYPLIHACRSRDIVIVQINPITRADVPTTPSEILDRMNEISFNSTLLREARAMGLINRLLGQQALDEDTCGLRPMYLHMIEDPGALANLGPASKLNADMGFLRELFALGSAAAGRWLDDHFDDLGRRSTFGVEGPDI
ncbi:MAG: patatin-like phospholipase family protein [Inquilinaceae bacterium]